MSSLIEAKGYIEFVEAITKLKETKYPIQAILCGKITTMDSDERFGTVEEARLWLEERLSQINQSQYMELRWIDGATGELKESLLRESQIFVLPSRYKVETQPIAIIEALASGCAVITSSFGEIPSMLENKTAIVLDEMSSDTIAEVIKYLYDQPNQRLQLAQQGLELFDRRFKRTTYVDSWHNLLLNILSN